ncbi:hypothetical protein JCM5353_007434 [Sporobolomyces roseus]
MKLDPKLFEMQAKVWRDPETERHWIEKEKWRRTEEKKKLEEEKHRKKVEIEKGKIERTRLKETGRFVLMGKEDLHLAKLKADVARLEAKEKASLLELPSIRIKESGKIRSVDHGVPAANRIGSRAELVENRRRELFDYKHYLNHLPAPCDPPTVDGRLKEKIADFTIRATGDSLIDLRIISQREPLQLELDLELPRNHQQLMIREREEIEIRLGEQQRELEDAMIREAIELGANGLIEFFVEGPFPIEEGELAGRHLLVASGIPVQFAQSRPRLLSTARRDLAALGGGWRNLDHFDHFDNRHGAADQAQGWDTIGDSRHDQRDLPPNAQDVGWHAAPPRMDDRRYWRNAENPRGWSQDATTGWNGGYESPRQEQRWRDQAHFDPYPPPYPHNQHGALEELERLPWGAQAYVRQMRAKQEREMREQQGHFDTLNLGRPAPFVSQEDPALFGNSFALPPRPPPQPHSALHPATYNQGGFESQPERQTSEWQRPTMDLDHGAGGIGKSAPWSPGEMPW